MKFLNDIYAELLSGQKEYQIPGVGIGVRLGEEQKITVSGATEFHMGSCGKAVTALLMHKLAKENHFGLQDRLSDLLPNIKIHQDYHSVTLNDVITHCSGLPANIDYKEEYFHPLDDHEIGKQRKTIMADLLSMPPASPIKNYVYSNIGYVLLAMIIAEKTGKPYEQLVEEHVFNPCQMDKAYFSNQRNDKKLYGHYRENGNLISEYRDNPAIYHPAGCIVSPIEEWLNFLEETKKFQDKNKEVAIQLNIADFYTNYAFIRSQEELSHSGSNGAHYACVRIVPEYNLLIAAATNEYSPPTVELLENISDKIVKNVSTHRIG